MKKKQHSILDHDWIDLVVEQEGFPILVIRDHLDWSNPDEHLAHLAKKLDVYTAYIKNGELDELKNPNAYVHIRWELTHDIPDEAMERVHEEELRLFPFGAYLKIRSPKTEKEEVVNDQQLIELYKLLCRPLPDEERLKDEKG